MAETYQCRVPILPSARSRSMAAFMTMALRDQVQAEEPDSSADQEFDGAVPFPSVQRRTRKRP